MKATFQVSLTIPAHLTALSNMPEKQTRHVAGGKKRVEFTVSPKMSTYLLAWAIGEFDFVQGVTKNGIQLRVFSPPGRASQGKFALDCGLRALDYYDEFFQVPYPLPKMDMICVTEFAMGAMENWGLVTYREVDLMIDEARASSQQKQRVAIVVAHELAHQWFGNLVTMSWWDGLWLNEGFAAWMEHFGVDELYPDYHIWEQFTTDSFGAAQRLDSLRTSHPIIVPIKHAEEVEQVFDAISYCKGSTVVNMVHAIVGKDKFREGLQVYMKRHAYGNTETKDLWQAWSEVSGVDIASVMKTWTTRMGYPYVKTVSEVWSDSSVEFTLEQSWFLADGSEPNADEAADAIWQIPLLFATSSSTSEAAVLMTEKRQTFNVPLAGAEDWLRINAGQKALLRVATSQEQLKRLLPAVKSKALGAVDRSALLLDSYALAKAGLAPVESVVDVLKALEDADSSVVWDAISMILNALNSLMQTVGGPGYDAFIEFGKRFVLKTFAKVGWDGRPDDGHSQKLLRATVVNLLETFAFFDPDVANEAKRRFDGHWEDPDLLPTDYRSTVYRIVLKNGGIAEYEAILKSFYATEDNAIKKFAFNLGAAQSVYTE
jgi:puromycin-sensitive aminopeptidase